jgi:hypothetical protein
MCINIWMITYKIKGRRKNEVDRRRIFKKLNQFEDSCIW